MLQLLDANAALLVAALGFLLICAEFCLPGWVAPGVLGGVLLVCGGYRLSELGAGAAVSAGVAAALIVTVSAGYGAAPRQLGWAALAVLPWLLRHLIPGAVAWWAALLAAGGPAAAFLLLRVAARAVANKTNL